MRHLKKGKILQRKENQRRALFRQMTRDFFRFNKIKSTEAKIKVLRPLVERLITKAKKGNLHHQRQLFKVLQDKKLVNKLIKSLGPQYKARPGGYTRIIKLGYRRGDNAPLARLELVPPQSSKKDG